MKRFAAKIPHQMRGPVSLLEKSNQRWKVFLFIGLMALGAAVTLLQGLLYTPLGKELTTQLVIGGMVLIAATFFWAGQNIVCPQCKLKLLYYAITKVGLGSWYDWLLTEEKCPDCGYPVQSPQKVHKRGKPR